MLSAATMLAFIDAQDHTTLLRFPCVETLDSLVNSAATTFQCSYQSLRSIANIVKLENHSGLHAFLTQLQGWDACAALNMHDKFLTVRLSP